MNINEPEARTHIGHLAWRTGIFMEHYKAFRDEKRFEFLPEADPA
jgi:hypothetical protein